MVGSCEPLLRTTPSSASRRDPRARTQSTRRSSAHPRFATHPQSARRPRHLHPLPAHVRSQRRSRLTRAARTAPTASSSNCRTTPSARARIPCLRFATRSTRCTTGCPAASRSSELPSIRRDEKRQRLLLGLSCLTSCVLSPLPGLSPRGSTATYPLLCISTRQFNRSFRIALSRSALMRSRAGASRLAGAG